MHVRTLARWCTLAVSGVGLLGVLAGLYSFFLFALSSYDKGSICAPALESVAGVMLISVPGAFVLGLGLSLVMWRGRSRGAVIRGNILAAALTWAHIPAGWGAYFWTWFLGPCA